MVPGNSSDPSVINAEILFASDANVFDQFAVGALAREHDGALVVGACSENIGKESTCKVGKKVEY